MRKYVFLGNFIYFSGFNNDRGLQLPFANNYNESANKYNESRNCNTYFQILLSFLNSKYCINYACLREQNSTQSLAITANIVIVP